MVEIHRGGPVYKDHLPIPDKGLGRPLPKVPFYNLSYEADVTLKGGPCVPGRGQSNHAGVLATAGAYPLSHHRQVAGWAPEELHLTQTYLAAQKYPLLPKPHWI